MKDLIASAENGDARAQYRLGVLYHDGKSVPKDYVQAAYWYRKAAEQGHVKAQLYLGLLYSRGYGVPRNYDNAVKWLTMSAENGNEKAQILLEDIIAEHESESVETHSHSPSRLLMLITSIVAALSVIIISSAYYFMKRTESILSSPIVKTLTSDEDDVLSPPARISPTNETPTNPPFNPDVFSLAESGTLPEIQNAILRGIIFRQTHDDGETPLHRAAVSNHDPEVIKLLVVHGLNVNSEWSGSTPLLLAVMNGNTPAALELLNHNANPNYIDSNSRSVMQNLIIAGNEGKINQNDITRIIIAMIRNGADINYYGSSSTPLSLAVQYDMPEVADLLLESNADVNIKDSSGKTASDYARSLRKDSALRKSPVFGKLTESSKIQAEVSERTVRAGRQQVEKLLKAKKVSPFVRDTGKFEFNPDYEDGYVEIVGSNVRMRKQPNTKSRIIKTTSGMSSNESLKYLGEWTSPKGDRWVLCDYKENQRVRDADAKVVWIFGDYTRLISAGERQSMLEDENVN